MALKESQKTLAAAVEMTGVNSVANLCPDRKGTFVKQVCESLKGRRTLHYTGIDIPRDVIREITKVKPGFVITSLPAPAPINAQLAWVEDINQLPMVAHNAFILLWGKEAPKGWQQVAGYKDEIPVWCYPPGKIPPKKFEVRTKNCVDDEKIKNNVLHSHSLHLPFLPRCSAHGLGAVMVSAGPSLVNHLQEIKELSEDPNNRVVCAKHSHDILIDYGIVPWVCVLLDPRDHVSQFVENPHRGVKYFISSTCHPTSYERLMAHNADIWVYHALVGAGEPELVRMYVQATEKEYRRVGQELRKLGVSVPPQPPHWRADQMVAGGTTAPSRGISLMHMLGFRRFHLLAFDSCYWEPQDLKKKKEDGTPRYHELSMAGKKWWTDAELIAQVQDFKHLASGVLPDVDFIPHGEGMIATYMRESFNRPADFNELFT